MLPPPHQLAYHPLRQHPVPFVPPGRCCYPTPLAGCPQSNDSPSNTRRGPQTVPRLNSNEKACPPSSGAASPAAAITMPTSYRGHQRQHGMDSGSSRAVPCRTAPAADQQRKVVAGGAALDQGLRGEERGKAGAWEMDHVRPAECRAGRQVCCFTLGLGVRAS